MLIVNMFYRTRACDGKSTGIRMSRISMWNRKFVSDSVVRPYHDSMVGFLILYFLNLPFRFFTPLLYCFCVDIVFNKSHKFNRAVYGGNLAALFGGALFRKPRSFDDNHPSFIVVPFETWTVGNDLISCTASWANIPGYSHIGIPETKSEMCVEFNIFTRKSKIAWWHIDTGIPLYFFNNANPFQPGIA